MLTIFQILFASISLILASKALYKGLSSILFNEKQ